VPLQVRENLIIIDKLLKAADNHRLFLSIDIFAHAASVEAESLEFFEQARCERKCVFKSLFESWFAAECHGIKVATFSQIACRLDRGKYRADSKSVASVLAGAVSMG
jgi:hypothetical protein